MALISFGALLCRGGKKLDDSSRLDVVEIARIRDMPPSSFPSWWSYGLISTSVRNWEKTRQLRSLLHSKNFIFLVHSIERVGIT